MKYLVQIKKKANVFHDEAFATWPVCKPPESEYAEEPYEYRTKYPDALFIAVKDGADKWTCVRDGYGSFKPGEQYGNGSIVVYGRKSVTIVGFNYIEKED